MRAPTARCFPHSCTLTYNSWTTDQDGGREVSTTTVVANVPCFAQPGRARTVMETADESGLRRITEVTPGTFYFSSDVVLRTNDLIAWVDPYGTSHNYIVLGYRQPCNSGTLWSADVEERV